MPQDEQHRCALKLCTQKVMGWGVCNDVAGCQALVLRAFTSGHADSQNSWRCTLVSWSSPKARRKTLPGSRCGHANQLHLFPKCLHRRKGLLKFGPAFLLKWYVARVAGPHGQWTQLFPTFTPVR